MIRRLAPILLLLLATSGPGLPAVPAARAATFETTDAILDSLQYGAFRYAWDQANPVNGLIRDRSQPGSPCSIAAQGFGFSAICIAVDHGWVSRSAAAARVLTALQTFWSKPQGPATTGTIGYKGFFYHFLDMNTAERMSTWNTELSTIDTALLLAGILDAKVFFDGSAPDEVQIRTLASAIYQRVEWPFMQNTSGGNAWSIRHGWNPSSGYLPFNWVGYSEAMILYILALGSNSFPMANPTLAWAQWTSGYQWQTHYGHSYVNFPPLFGHQYSHCWIDFRGIRDAYMQARGIDYFENSRRATLAQRAYAIANPLGRVGYSATLWGLTASDGPTGYNARGAPPAQNDDGTITPTAPISSIAFAPAEVIPVIENLYDNYKSLLWGPYGFRDAFNLTVNPDWYGADVIGIDQGPITIMIENYRTGRVWNRFMQNPEIIAGLQQAGFNTVVGVDEPRPGPVTRRLEVAPNPIVSRSTILYQLERAGRVRLAVYDVGGREVARLVDAVEEAGFHEAALDGARLPSGVYRCRLEADGTTLERIVVRLR